MKIEEGQNYYRIEQNTKVLIFRFENLYKNTQVQHIVRGKIKAINFTERNFFNRIDIYQIENDKEIYKTNINFTHYNHDEDIKRECINYFVNWLNLNCNFKQMMGDKLPDEKLNIHYEDDKYESLFLNLNNQTLVFIPQQRFFNTERINVFQITDNNQFLYRSNFQIHKIQNKDDFIATCIKYFYIWIKENKNSFNNPKFNQFPWKADIHNAWWEFDRWPEMHVYTPRTLQNPFEQDPDVSPFILWKKSEGYEVDKKYTLV